MVGVELVAGYVFAWVAGKARRVGGRVNGHVDAVLDDGVDHAARRLHELVAAKLKGDPAFERLEVEAGQGAVTPSTRTAARVALAVEEAAEQDAEFARAIGVLLDRLRDAQAGASPVVAPGGVAAAGSLHISAGAGGVAAAVIHGGAQVGNPPVPGLPLP